MAKASQRTYRYQAFGLGILSELYLPELPEVDSEPDAEIRLGEVRTPGPTAPIPGGWSTVQGSEACVGWRGVGSFRVRAGTEIVVEPEAGVPPERVRLFLLGAALGLLLHQRGVLVLHASAVSIDGGAVAFLGGKRSGKSTIAALLHARGHEVICDDVLALDLAGRYPLVLPGIPQLKLWPDSLTMIGQSPSALRRLHPEFEKREYLLETRFASKSEPLRAVYVLDFGDTPGMDAFEAHEALSQLIGHWYCARFSYETLLALGISPHFLQSTEIVRRVPFYRLTRPRLPSGVADVVATVEGLSARCWRPTPASTADLYEETAL